jgi:HEAT repeat protein
LGEIGPAAKEAVPDLIAALKDQEEDVRSNPADPLLKDLGGHVRRAAARALGRIGPAAKEAVPDLIAALKDQDWSVRHNVALALEEIRPKE